MIEHQYNIVYEGQRHFYALDLDVRHYNLESSMPYNFSIHNHRFESKSWGRMIEEVSNYLILINSPLKKDLLNIDLDWTNQYLYIENPNQPAHLGPLENGLYVNTNHTSTHLMWILQDLLNYYNINLNNCRLLIKRPPGKEKKEVTEYFLDKANQDLKHFLRDTLDKDTDFIKIVMDSIEIIDEAFEQKFKSYKSIMLFETRQEYSLIKSRFLKHLKKKVRSQKTFNNIKMILDILTQFYRHTYPPC